MASSAATEPSSRPSVFEWIAANKRRTAYALFVLGALLALIPVWLGIAHRDQSLPTVIMTAGLALVPLAGGLWQLLRHPDPDSELGTARMLVLGVGGLLGFAGVLVAAALAYQWWDTVTGGVKEWRGPHAWRLWVCIVVLLASLGTVFASLQLGRTEERSNYVLRRLLYGYNAVLTGILVLTILIVINVLVSVYMTGTYDWTTQSIYALSSRSENILQSLSKPTKVYVIMPQSGDAYTTYRRVQALLDNCRAVNDRLQIEYLSPDLDRDRVNDLAQRYHFGERDGLLVVYGAEPNVEHQFISVRSLYGGSEASFSRSRENRYFKGESELMTTLAFLESGKQKPTIYFVQGNGELDLNDVSAQEIGRGAATLKERMEAGNYTVKALQLTDVAGLKSKQADRALANQVPEDADAVVIAGPRRMPRAAVDALRKYMEGTGADNAKKRGKLVVLLDAPSEGATGELAGLENLLTEFNVQVGNNRVLAARSGQSDPRWLPVTVNPSEDMRRRNPIVGAFDPRLAFLFYNARTVENKPGQGPRAGSYRGDDFLMAPAEALVWAETDLRTPARDFLRGERVNELPEKISRSDLSVGIAVSATTGMPFHGGGEEKPCLVVIGNASFVSNWCLRQEARLGRLYDLFTSCLGWLRERPADIGIEPKRPDTFELNAASVNGTRLVLLPAGLMIVGVIGLGTGVWLVRRR